MTKKPTLEEKIRLVLIEYGSKNLTEWLASKHFSKAHGYMPDGSWLPARYAKLIMHTIARHKGKI